MKKRLPIRNNTGKLTEEQLIDLISGDVGMFHPFDTDDERREVWNREKLYLMTRKAQNNLDDLFTNFLPCTRPDAFWVYELGEKRPGTFQRERLRLIVLELLDTEELAQWDLLVQPLPTSLHCEIKSTPTFSVRNRLPGNTYE